MAVSGSSASAHHSITSRFHIAREPDFQVDEVWKWTEYWEVAEGGASIPDCIPAINGSSCDFDTRFSVAYELSPLILQDLQHSLLTPHLILSLISLAPAFTYLACAICLTLLIATDCNSGHYIYKRTITNHDTSLSAITVNELLWFCFLFSNVCRDCLFDGEDPTLGLYSAWLLFLRTATETFRYVENKLEFLDSDGEYFYDPDTRMLYLKKSGTVDWSKLEA